MEHMFRELPGGPHPWDYSTERDLASPTILLVEDDRDIRELITTLLDLAGFAVVACDTAECGLNALREQEFDLILTDYALPRHSGVWLIQHAEAEGLIQGTPVMIVTAHPSVDGADNYEVIHKPFDLDELVERVRQRTEGDGPRRRRAASVAPRAGSPGDLNGGAPSCPDPVELILYVSAQSPRSLAAVGNIRKVLERFAASRVKLTVCDLSQNPNGGVEDAIAFTPTLVRRAPGPRTFILGHITNPELVLELLADCEMEQKN